MTVENEVLEQKSRFLCFLLRHRPQAAHLCMNKEGWCTLEQIFKNTDITAAELDHIVQSDSKNRYSYSKDKSSVRANQGHSTALVDIKFEKAVPPPVLYHGTNGSILADIMRKGLLPMNRRYVHLSADQDTAQSVAGRRKKKTAILKIDAAKMLADGGVFFLSDNNVWLVTSVLPKYIEEINVI
jgi:putative RNA 2'-phosphotransferase